MTKTSVTTDKIIDIVFAERHAEGSAHEISKWLKQVGDRVKENEPILEINTDKVAIEIAAPVTGILVEILRTAPGEVHVGETLGRIQTLGKHENESRSQTGQQASQLNEDRLSAAVRGLLKKHNIDPRSIVGTGKGGRITTQDVNAHVSKQNSPAISTRKPHSIMRRTIAQRMQESLQTAPHVTAVVEVDFSSVFENRLQLSQSAPPGKQPVTPLCYIVQACVHALKQIPTLNSRWHEKELEIFTDYHIGIAMSQFGEALVVPVLRHADRLDLQEIANQIRAFREKSIENKLHQSDMEGGTFSISNHGVGGSLFAMPIIINQPQSAILGIGKIEERVCVLRSDSEPHVAIRPRAYISLTIDHRVVDGAVSDAFLMIVKNTLEGWPN